MRIIDPAARQAALDYIQAAGENTTVCVVTYDGAKMNAVITGTDEGILLAAAELMRCSASDMQAPLLKAVLDATIEVIETAVGKTSTVENMNVEGMTCN